MSSKLVHGGGDRQLMKLRVMAFGWSIAAQWLEACRELCLMPPALRKTWRAKDGQPTNLQNSWWTTIWVEMFGPFLIKEGRSWKDIGEFSHILTNRAVHIQCTCSMENDLFIQALRQVMARRGNMSLVLW